MHFLQAGEYLPSSKNIFNAFRLPLLDVRYILFGQDPYPRPKSASGYAFIDANVKNLFGPKGLSKEVNRATSLRNMMKLFLGEYDQAKIAMMDKSVLINSIDDLRKNFEKNGVLLLNHTLVFTTKEEIRYHTKQWKGFTQRLLYHLQNRDIRLILLGNIAKEILQFEEARGFEVEVLEHPYNISFIENQKAKELFLPMKLLML